MVRLREKQRQPPKVLGRKVEVLNYLVNTRYMVIRIVNRTDVKIVFLLFTLIIIHNGPWAVIWVGL